MTQVRHVIDGTSKFGYFNRVVNGDGGDVEKPAKIIDK